MTMNPLPPQAYTKDTLVKAFQWIQLQGTDIKQLASTPDVLVSLYLKAKLQGEAVLERPSIVNFKNELKNLAGQLGEFAPAQELVNERAFDLAYGKSTQEQPTQVHERAPHSGAPAPQTPAQNHSQAQAQFHSAPGQSHNLFHHQFQQTPPVTTAPTAAPVPGSAAMVGLDEKSLAAVREVRELSNLQSDTEALRLLISVGAKHVKQILR